MFSRASLATGSRANVEPFSSLRSCHIVSNGGACETILKAHISSSSDKYNTSTTTPAKSIHVLLSEGYIILQAINLSYNDGHVAILQITSCIINAYVVDV